MVQSKPKIAWSKDAFRMRREFVAAGGGSVFDALERWLAANEHLWVRARVVGDPESEEPWSELLIEIAVDADRDAAYLLWDAVARLVSQKSRAGGQELFTRVAGDVGVVVLWGADLQPGN